jgi:hypothetical protein
MRYEELKRQCENRGGVIFHDKLHFPNGLNTIVIEPRNKDCWFYVERLKDCLGGPVYGKRIFVCEDYYILIDAKELRYFFPKNIIISELSRG